ncbi:MAG TPA: o-succinylbenzoate--CoA ligase [Myxococcales bacterium]|nr:o-succinylbenzoate--CoA ligase [Myxococcales bacterium]
MDGLAVAAEGVRWSHGDLDARARAWAERLAAHGVAEGDRVAHLSRATPDAVALTHGIWRLGAVTVPLNTRLTASELAPQLEALQPRLTLVDPAFEDRRFLEGERPRARAPAPTDTAAILFTSGTTGRPKAAALSHANLAAAAAASARNVGGAPGDRWLLCLPLFHVGGLTMLHRCSAYGAALIVHERFDAAAASRALDEEGVTHASLVATTLRRLLDARAGRRLPPSVRAILIGGGPVPAPLLEQARALGAPVLQTYGLTESCAQVTTERPGEADGLTAGPPLPGLRVRIVGEQGEDLPPGAVGEIEVSGPTVFQGYVDDESETHQVLWKGWLRTRDLGSLDARGRLAVAARRSDLIISGGENVYPAEVEAVLLGAPGVVEAAVVGRPDPEWGQVPVAAVVPGPGFSPEAAERHCRAHLAGYKVPRRFVPVRQLPRNAGGKVDRPTLIALLASGG